MWVKPKDFRISKHLEISYRSSIKLTSPFSAIKNHLQNKKDYNLTTNQFKIISSFNTDFELSLRESLP